MDTFSQFGIDGQLNTYDPNVNFNILSRWSNLHEDNDDIGSDVR